MSYCLNQNDDHFLNKCFATQPVGVQTLFANFIVQFVNPRTLAISVLFIIMALPMLNLHKMRLSETREKKRKYAQLKLHLVNFLHRLTFSLILDVGLYAIFRQHRPCICSINGGPLTKVGSIYGMPSGDAMAAAIFAAYIFDAAPFNKFFSRFFAVIILLWVCMERVVLGYHSIAQVTVGSSIGIILHIYSSRVPQFMIFVDAIVQTALTIVTLQIDPALVYQSNDQNDLFSWFLWGLSFEVFVLLLTARHYFNKKNIRKILNSIETLGRQQTFASDEEDFASIMSKADDRVVTDSQMMRVADHWFVLASFGVFALFNFFSYIQGQYNLMVKYHH